MKIVGRLEMKAFDEISADARLGRPNNFKTSVEY